MSPDPPQARRPSTWCRLCVQPIWRPGRKVCCSLRRRNRAMRVLGCYWPQSIHAPQARRELPRSDVKVRRVVLLRSVETLVLIEFRGDGPIRSVVPTAVAHDSNHVAGRALSAATRTGVPEANSSLPVGIHGTPLMLAYNRRIAIREASPQIARSTTRSCLQCAENGQLICGFTKRTIRGPWKPV